MYPDYAALTDLAANRTPALYTEEQQLPGFLPFQTDGAAYIQKMIQAAQESGIRQITITGNYEIEDTIRIPSDFTLVLDNCYLLMANNTYCNMFTNVHCHTEAGKTTEGTDRNIIIEGRGRVILDGGMYNGLAERNHSKNGNPHISVNNLILFSNVSGFRISGLHLRNNRWWAMCFHFCRNGHIRDIDFRSDCRMWHTDGTLKAGLSWKTIIDPNQMFIQNADGLDIRVGCHDILIEHITGFTQDDTVALTALDNESSPFYVSDLCPDIYNITVRDINAASLCALVRLLNQGGLKLYNILIDGVFDASKECHWVDRGHSGIRIGDTCLYRERHSTADETYNIVIRNVFTRAFVGIRLAGSIRNLSMEHISGFDGCGTLQAGEILSKRETAVPEGVRCSRHHKELSGPSILIDSEAANIL